MKCLCGCDQETTPGKEWRQGHFNRGIGGYNRPRKPLTAAQLQHFVIYGSVNAKKLARLNDKDFDRQLFKPSIEIAGKDSSWDDPYARIDEILLREADMIDPRSRIVYAHHVDHTPPDRPFLDFTYAIEQADADKGWAWARARVRQLRLTG